MNHDHVREHTRAFQFSFVDSCWFCLRLSSSIASCEYVYVVQTVIMENQGSSLLEQILLVVQQNAGASIPRDPAGTSQPQPAVAGQHYPGTESTSRPCLQGSESLARLLTPRTMVDQSLHQPSTTSTDPYSAEDYLSTDRKFGKAKQLFRVCFISLVTVATSVS